MFHEPCKVSDWKSGVPFSRFEGCGVENLPPLCMAQPVMAGVCIFASFFLLASGGA